MMFLKGFELRPVQLKDTGPFNLMGLVLGKGNQPLEVIVLRAEQRPGQRTEYRFKDRCPGQH